MVHIMDHRIRKNQTKSKSTKIQTEITINTNTGNKNKEIQNRFDATLVRNNKRTILILLLAIGLTHYMTTATEIKDVPPQKPILVDTRNSEITEEDYNSISTDRVVTHYDCSYHDEIEMYTTMEVDNCDVRSSELHYEPVFYTLHQRKFQEAVQANVCYGTFTVRRWYCSS